MTDPKTRRTALRCALLCAGLFAAAGAQAEAAHVHGVVRLDVAVDAGALTVHLDAPLDSLLGFEHRPRTAAQRQAADALLARLKDGATLLRPDAAAQCSLVRGSFESEALQPKAAGNAKPASRPGQPAATVTAPQPEHADLDATYEFTCLQPARLTGIDTAGLFDAFARIQRIEVQLAGARSQGRQTLSRADRRLRLVP